MAVSRRCLFRHVRTISLLALLCGDAIVHATGVPIDGFLPMVGITLTDEFVHDIDFFPRAETSIVGTPISANGSLRYDVALFDTGAAISLLTTAADAAFNIDGPYSGEPEGFRGTESITIGGATGQLQASIGDPLGLYVAGLQNRTSSGASLGMNAASFRGQSNTSMATLPAESDLPNVLGLSFSSQYATRISNSQPQVFDLNGKTVRSPAIELLPLGTGNLQGISRKAPMSVLGASPSSPFYQLNIGNFNLDKPWEDPSTPTVVQGGHFLNVNATNNSSTLSNQQFFFDTGASVTVLSELTALQLGIDVQTDVPDFTLDVVGSGGSSGAVPGYYIDQFTVLATGGSVVLNNVPVLVFDVTNPANPGNIVPGIVGTNVFTGRDIVIDPNPSLGGGGPSAGVYISDPVTTNRNWASTAASAPWTTAANWSGSAVPTYTGIANVRRVAGSSGMQTATVSGAAQASELNVSGDGPAQTMTVAVGNASLTTFSGLNIEGYGLVTLDGGTIDAQYVELKNNGALLGQGIVRTGSGPIAGQVENIGGKVSVGNANHAGTLEIDGRFANSGGATLEFTLAGSIPGTNFGQLDVNGSASFGGTLRVVLASGYTPAVGSVYTLATYDSHGGTFSTLDLPGSFQWSVDYGAMALTLTALTGSLPGDFNNSGVVNAADLSVWKSGFGPAPGYSGGDFLTWQRHYVPGSGVAAVPEPATLVLLAAAAGCIGLRRVAGGLGARG